MPTKTTLITGASSGIGAALAEALTRRGDTVVLVARREKELQEVAARCGDRALPIRADVTRREDFRRAIATGLATFGHIDVLVNNAGQGITRPPTQLTDADVDDMIRINVKSVLYGMQEILPHFQERDAGQIINVSSMLGRIPMAVFRSAYSGAKHFVNALTAMTRAELRESHPGIRVTLVSPAVVATDFGLSALHGGPDSRSFPNAQPVDEVVRVLVEVIDHPRDDVYTAAGASERVAAYYAGIGEDP